jgi:outer membrane protein TolC
MQERDLPKGTRTTKRLTCGALALAGLVLCASANAQMSLSTAVDLALHNDPKVRMAQADLDKAKASLAEAKDAYIPNVGVNGGYGTSTGVPLNVPTVFQMSSQSLLFNFSQRDNLRSAASGVKAAELGLAEARDKIAEDVVITYIDLDNAQQRQAAMTEEYGYATRLVTIVNERVGAGQDTQLQSDEASITADQIQVNELNTREEVDTLTDHLSRLVGLPGSQVYTVASSIPALPAPGTFVDTGSVSFGVQSAFASAKSKQEAAFGESRYLYRPQLSFGANYSRISTAHTNYPLYYPGFQSQYGLSDNALSVDISIQIPLFDRAHVARAHVSAAEAAHARYEAEDARNQYLEGRFKLVHSTDVLVARCKLAEAQQLYAKDELDATLAQLTANSAGTGATQLTPKDEQNARIEVSTRTIDFLNDKLQLSQTQVNLLRQTGQLDDWLKLAIAAPGETTVQPLNH